MASVAVPPTNLSARVPFVGQLAREFGRSKNHIWRVVSGERTSPLRQSILDRQAELMRQAAAAAQQPVSSNPSPPNEDHD